MQSGSSFLSNIFLRLFLLPIFFLSVYCYKAPQSSSLLDFLNFKSSVDAINSPIGVFVQVSGLSAGILTVTNHLGESLPFGTNGTQQFPTFVHIGDPYSVSITGPTGSPAQTCKINNPDGPILYPSTTIFITCGVVFYDLSVRVIGLDPSVAGTTPLVIQNMTDRLSYSSDGTKKFASKIGDTASYSISLISVPTGHTCFFIPNLSGSGNLSGGPLTVLLDCITPIDYQPHSKIIAGAGKITIKLSYHGIDAGSCSINMSAFHAGRYNAGSIGNEPAITYPSDNTIVLTPDPTDLWGPGGETFIQLSGCTAASGLPIQNGADILYEFTFAPNIRFVDINNGTDITGCGTGGPPSAYCKSIEFGIGECAIGVPCSVYVAAGTYIPTFQLNPGDFTSLIGGFPSGFSSLDPDPINNPTIIQDPGDTSGPAFCGSTTLGGTTCSTIFIDTVSLNPASTSLTISGFQIRANPNADNSIGIQVESAQFNSGQIRILQNTISGNETSTFTGPGAKAGIAIINSDNVIISDNWIRGGSGSSSSFGIYLPGAGASGAGPIVISRNIIDGLQSDPSGFSVGILMESAVAIIAGNKINAYQYLNPSLTSNRTVGISLADSFAGPSYIFNNDIYVGNSPIASLGASTGILVDIAGVHTILNNQIFSQSSLSNSIGIDFRFSPDPSSIIRGNNFFVSTPVRIGSDQYVFCGLTLNQEDCAHPISAQFVGDYSNSYGNDPKFKATTQIDQVWNFNTPTGIPTTANSPCTSLYGGVNLNIGPMVPLIYLPLFATDFAQNPRTSTPTIFTPPGAGSISIGVYEADAICF